MSYKTIPPEELAVVALLDDPGYDPVATQERELWLHSPFLVRWTPREDLYEGLVVEVEARISDDLERIPVSVRIAGNPPPTAQDFRDIPLASLLRAGAEQVVFPGPEHPAGTRQSAVRPRGPQRLGPWVGELREAGPAGPDEAKAAHPRRGPRKLTDEFLRQVVEAKRLAEHHGQHPKPFVARRFPHPDGTPVHEQTVAKWFQEARKPERGPLLEPYEPKKRRRQ